MMEEAMTDCNLELQLHPSSSSSISSPLQPNDHTHQQHHQQQLPLEKMSGEEHPLTIFYGGSICVVNVNQQQAKSIMLLAGRGGGAIDERTRNVSEARNLQQCNSQALTSLPMKRSLQRFLERRKHRIQSTNPYQDNK